MIYRLLFVVYAILSSYAHFPAPASDAPNPECIAVVGDSVAYGTLVVMMPGHGYATVRTQPLSAVLQAHLDAVASELVVYDFSVPASSLSFHDDKIYRQTSEYQRLLKSNCKYIWIAPWVNDLTHGSTPQRADEYADALKYITTKLVFQRQDREIVIMGFYPMKPADFTESYYGDGVYAENTQRFNDLLTKHCANPQHLGGIRQVQCMPTMPLFESNAHLYRRSEQARFFEQLYAPLPPEDHTLIEAFWRQNPAASVTLDGVHLSEGGKRALVEHYARHYLPPHAHQD